jgi:hypothetical protein
MVEQFFLYEHEFSNGVRYVGKGLKARPTARAQARAKSPYWQRLFHKYGPPVVRVLLGPLPEELALLAEVELIHKYRALGVPLCNLTDGGEGITGRRASAAEREANRVRANAWREANPDIAARITDALVRRNRLPAVAAENARRLNTADVKARSRPARSATMRTDAFRAQAAERTKRMWLQPGMRERMAVSLRQRDTRKLSEAMRKLFADKSKHPRTDHTVYSFTHRDGRVFVGRRIDLCAAFGVRASQLSAVFAGRFKSTLGWSVSKESHE